MPRGLSGLVCITFDTTYKVGSYCGTSLNVKSMKLILFMWDFFMVELGEGFVNIWYTYYQRPSLQFDSWSNLRIFNEAAVI